MIYKRCGGSGLKMPVIALGLWNNFGAASDDTSCWEVIKMAFDKGITHFDLADNYGPPPGSAETRFGKILKDQLAAHRDELVISTKAGHPMWNGVYGDGGSRKHLLAALDQSLQRLGLDYVDIFYHHRPDPETPIEESMGALVSAVRQGKALYVALSKYPADKLTKACAILREEKVPCLAHQIRYNLLEHPEGILEAADACGCGNIVFSPLAQGLLTHKYAQGIPADSRMTKDTPCLKPSMLTPEVTEKLRVLNAVAQSKGQSLTQYALRWLLDHPLITSIIIGARTPEQLLENCAVIA